MPIDLIQPIIRQVPTGYGYILALVVLALFVQKEMWRAWVGQDLSPEVTVRTQAEEEEQMAVTARRARWRRVENRLIGMLLGLYGFILLIRLLSFFP